MSNESQPPEERTPIDGTKKLLDTIISWEKDLSDYQSLESKLRQLFVIEDRQALHEEYEAFENKFKTKEQTAEYLRKEGYDPEELAKQGVVFVHNLMELVKTKNELTALREENEKLKNISKEMYNALDRWVSFRQKEATGDSFLDRSLKALDEYEKLNPSNL